MSPSSEQLVDLNARHAEQRSRLAPESQQLEDYAAQYGILRQERESGGNLEEPSFEEIRAYRATQGMTITDEDYQHELAIYRKETGLDLAEAEVADRRTDMVLREKRFNSEIELESAEFVKGLSSLTYLDVRGAFYRVELLDSHQASKARGVYAIEELDRLARDEEAGQLEAPILINGVETTQRDVVSQMSCLDNSKIFYTFGQSFGNAMISGEILLGPLGNMTVGERGGVRRLLDFFWTYRVSVYERPIAVSINGEAFYVYLTGLGLGKVDPDLHTLSFVLTGTLLDLSREDLKNAVSKVNASSTVNTDSGLERGLVISNRLVESQAGPVGNATAAQVEALNSEEVAATQDTPEQLAELQRQVWETDGSNKFGVSPSEKLKKLSKTQQAASDKQELGKLKGPADTKTSEISDSIKRTVADDLKRDSTLSGGALLSDTEENRRRSALNRAAWEVSQKRGADFVYTPEGQAEAYLLAQKNNAALFSGTVPQANQRIALPDARPKEALELELLQSRTESYVAQKLDGVKAQMNRGPVPETALMTNEEQRKLIRDQLLKNGPTEKAITNNMVQLEKMAEAGSYPVDDYNKLAVAFNKRQLKITPAP